jgi:hypothetical protein
MILGGSTRGETSTFRTRPAACLLLSFTRLGFRLHEVDRVTGGMLVLPPTAEVVEGVVAAAAVTPEELLTMRAECRSRR